MILSILIIRSTAYYIDMEQISVFFLVLSFLIYKKNVAKNKIELQNIFISGLFIGLANLAKQQAFIFIPLIPAFYLYDTLGEVSAKRILTILIIFFSGFIFPQLGLFTINWIHPLNETLSISTILPFQIGYPTYFEMQSIFRAIFRISLLFVPLVPILSIVAAMAVVDLKKHTFKLHYHEYILLITSFSLFFIRPYQHYLIYSIPFIMVITYRFLIYMESKNRLWYSALKYALIIYFLIYYLPPTYLHITESPLLKQVKFVQSIPGTLDPKNEILALDILPQYLYLTQRKSMNGYCHTIESYNQTKALSYNQYLRREHSMNSAEIILFTNMIQLKNEFPQKISRAVHSISVDSINYGFNSGLRDPVMYTILNFIGDPNRTPFLKSSDHTDYVIKFYDDEIE